MQSPPLLWGLTFGLVLLTVICVAARGSSRQQSDIWPIGGLLIGGSAFGVVLLTDEIELVGLIGLATIVAAAIAADKLSLAPWVGALATVPGVYLLSLAAPSDPAWVRPVIMVVVPVAGFLVTDFEIRYRHLGLGVLFFVVAATGSFLAVPDTEWVIALFAVCVPLTFLAWPKVIVSMGIAGAYLSAAVFVLFTATGGIARPASVIGAIAGLGFLVVEPVAVRIRPVLRSLPVVLKPSPKVAILASGLQVAVVFVTSRVAARFTDATKATIVVAITLSVSCALLLWAGERRVPEVTSGYRGV